MFFLVSLSFRLKNKKAKIYLTKPLKNLLDATASPVSLSLVQILWNINLSPSWKIIVHGGIPVDRYDL